MFCTAAAVSFTGRVRKNNEDNYCIDAEALPLDHGDSAPMVRELEPNRPHLVGVFDGMGGCRDGEQASFLAACATQRRAGRLEKRRDARELLEALCLEANDIICAAADGSQMGTTCALLYLYGNRYTVCNVGDSPVFLLRGGALYQLSQEHTQRASYEAVTGKPAPRERKFPLTQCLGIPREELLIQPFARTGSLLSGDVFLLCSDGITDMLPPEAIHEILSEGGAERIVSALARAALDAGGRDNLTAQCVTVPSAKNGVMNRLLRRISGGAGKEMP